MAIHVTRHPYSFRGASGRGKKQRYGSWHDGLKRWADGTDAGAQLAEANLRKLGAEAGIKFVFDQQTVWHPTASQRLLLWAGEFGKSEIFMENVNRLHFEEGKSVALQETLMEAVHQSGLDVEDAVALLETDKFEEEVWKSFEETMNVYHIHSIPYFVFHVPDLNMVSPFQDSNHATQSPWIVNGSMNSNFFLELFEEMFQAWQLRSKQ